MSSDGLTPLLDSVVVYDGLPISSGGAHGLRRLDATAAIEAWRGFLDACTEQASLVTRFTVADGVKPPRDVLRQLKSRFGQQHEWLDPWFPFGPERLDEAAEWMQQVAPNVTDAQGYSSLYLTADASFLLKRPDGVGLWHGQSRDRFGGFETPGGIRLGECTTRLAISAHRSMSLHLSLPLATDDEVAQVQRWLEPHLPFRLSDKHWTRWTLNRNGRSYSGRRVAVG